MTLLCSVGFHSWDGCRCGRCGKTRDAEHAWSGCNCTRCGATRDAEHHWDGCTCAVCGKERNHDFSPILCSSCGKRRNVDDLGTEFGRMFFDTVGIPRMWSLFQKELRDLALKPGLATPAGEARFRSMQLESLTAEPALAESVNREVRRTEPDAPQHLWELRVAMSGVISAEEMDKVANAAVAICIHITYALQKTAKMQLQVSTGQQFSLALAEEPGSGVPDAMLAKRLPPIVRRCLLSDGPNKEQWIQSILFSFPS